MGSLDYGLENSKATRDLMIDGNQGVKSYHVFGGQEIDLTSEDHSILIQKETQATIVMKSIWVRKNLQER